jgi:hypothetical protein
MHDLVLKETLGTELKRNRGSQSFSLTLFCVLKAAVSSGDVIHLFVSKKNIF